MPSRDAKDSLKPNEEFSIMVRQIMPATASITKKGEMTSVRTMFTPRKSWFNIRPKRIPRTVQAAREINVISAVLRTTA